MGKTGQKAWNKTLVDLNKLRTDYTNRVPVTKIAAAYGVTVQTIYSRLKEIGITRTNSEAHVGQDAWNKGLGHQIDSMGYRRIWSNGRQVREHRFVAEKMLGRKLRKGEVVHHINHDRSDNRPENLEIHTTHSEHMREHMTSDEARKRGSRGLATKMMKANYNPKVSFIPSKNRWVITQLLKGQGKKKHLGTYRTEVEALAALKAVGA